MKQWIRNHWKIFFFLSMAFNFGALALTISLVQKFGIQGELNPVERIIFGIMPGLVNIIAWPLLWLGYLRIQKLRFFPYWVLFMTMFLFIDFMIDLVTFIRLIPYQA